MASVRRLTAILAADVAGYSRLMGADEEGTHKRLKVHLGELVNPKIRQHRGRIVKNTGDGLLAEFASVVDAVRRAVMLREYWRWRRAIIGGAAGIPRSTDTASTKTGRSAAASRGTPQPARPSSDRAQYGLCRCRAAPGQPRVAE
jgi:hypothetical protein